MATLSAQGLVRRFAADVLAVDEVSLTVEEGHVTALIGPSGCGKTTILRLIAGLDRPDAGDVLLDGQSILDRAPHRRGVGLLFQELALFPHLNVRDNVAFGLRMAGWPRERRDRRVHELLELVGLGSLGERRIDELSGGERQRVALARTLAPEPAVLLLDEPLGAVDEARKRALRQELRALLHRLGTTALVVSHDLRDAQALADDLLVMADGRILQGGAVSAVVADPASAEVAAMLGYELLLEGVIREGRVHEQGVGALELDPATAAIPSAGPSPMPSPILLRAMAHPASLLGVPPDRGLGCGVCGEVVAAYAEGPLEILELRLGGVTSPRARHIAARWERDSPAPALGSQVELAPRPGSLRLFPSPASAG